MLKRCDIQQRNGYAGCEGMISRETLVCPKPIRVCGLNLAAADSIGTLRWNLSRQTEISESAARTDLLGKLLLKGGSGSHGLEVDSPPPFFSGSPPSRVSNPLIKDARFNEEKRGSPVSQLQRSITGLGSPSPYARKGGYLSASFGKSPVVRIEGFACMNSGGRSSTISARA